MTRLTAKHFKVLQVLAKDEPVVAPFDSGVMRDLSRVGYARGQNARATSGKLLTSAIWTITDLGRRWLDAERAGQ